MTTYKIDGGMRCPSETQYIEAASKAEAEAIWEEWHSSECSGGDHEGNSWECAPRTSVEEEPSPEPGVPTPSRSTIPVTLWEFPARDEEGERLLLEEVLGPWAAGAYAGGGAYAPMMLLVGIYPEGEEALKEHLSQNPLPEDESLWDSIREIERTLEKGDLEETLRAAEKAAELFHGDSSGPLPRGFDIYSSWRARWETSVLLEMEWHYSRGGAITLTGHHPVREAAITRPTAVAAGLFGGRS